MAGKGLMKRDGQIGPANPFPPMGSFLMSKITKERVLSTLGREGLILYPFRLISSDPTTNTLGVTTPHPIILNCYILNNSGKNINSGVITFDFWEKLS